MSTRSLGILVTCGALAALSLMISSVSIAQAPPPASAATPLPAIAPSIPPAYVVNLATAEGMTAFKAQWKNMDVKIVEAPAMPNAGAAWKTSYDITPKAGEAGFARAAESGVLRGGEGRVLPLEQVLRNGYD